MNRTILPAAVCAAIFLASCSQEPKVEKPVRTPVYVGKIDRVYKNYNYVLIRLFGAVPETGMTLISQPPEGNASTRIANLVVTAERIGKLRVPADIRSGSVEEGDIVFRYQNLATPESREQESTGKQEGEEGKSDASIPVSQDASHPGDEGIIGLPAYDPMPTKDLLPEIVTEPEATPEQSAKPQLTPTPKKKPNSDLDDIPSRYEDEL